MISLSRKSRRSPVPPFPAPSRRRDGIAIILVLAFLVLISALIIAFFTSVTTELSGAKSYASGATARSLADSSVNVAMAAVAQATTVPDPTQQLAWASQPGMIRTYDDSGLPHAFYKLYSSDSMIVSTFPYDPLKEVDPKWSTQPAMYTDLNAPVTNGSKTTYPILDPTAKGAVKGFDIQNSSLIGAGNQAPMPTKWLYMLNDGKLTAATGIDASGNTATFKGTANPPSPTNPIVGRIAFWTDDDTCKVNINTAAGDAWTDSASAPGGLGNPGSYWDVPRVFNTFDQTYLAQRQPATNEFQRYPGHPATTYLSAVFPTLKPADIFQIAPKVKLGGTESGTKVSSGTIDNDLDRLYASVDELLFSATRSDPSKRDSNPVLTDQLISPTRFFLTAHSRAPEVNLFNQPRIVTWPVSTNTTAAYRTQFDSLLAFCGTLNPLNQYPYYFQRSDSTSPTADLLPQSRNAALINYLRALTSKAVPGFGGGTFRSKYPKDRDQILTEIFDYIRCLNTQDVSVGRPPVFNPYTPVPATQSASGGGVTGEGQVIPIIDDSHADDNTETLRGFGRFPTVREASVVFVGVGQTATQNGVQLKSIPPDSSQAPGTPIADGKTRVQAFFSFSLFDPSQGFAIMIPDYQVRVTGLSGFQWNGVPMGFPAAKTIKIQKHYNCGVVGGYIGASTSVEPRSGSATATVPTNFVSTYIDLPSAGDPAAAFSFTGATITVDILDPSGSTIFQTLNIPFPAIGQVPVPQLAPLVVDDGKLPGNVQVNAINADYRSLTGWVGSVGGLSPMTNTPKSPGRFVGAGANSSFSTSLKTWTCGKDVVRSVQANTDYRTIAAKKTVPATDFSPMSDYFSSTVRPVLGIAETENGNAFYPFFGCSIGVFVPNANYGTSSPYSTDLTYITATPFDLGYSTTDKLQPVAKPPGPTETQRAGAIGCISFGLENDTLVPLKGAFAGTNKTGASATNLPPGDWDTGFSVVPDGPYINKADEGTIFNIATQAPYYNGLLGMYATAGSYFSPNRQMPSPVMFGSLPTGVHSDKPWQTLLFRPDPGGHLGGQQPKDHLLLDLFSMPVVQPYPISDPFSTAGKVNMNYQIVPFTYLQRSTAVQAVLRSEQQLVLANTDAANYKKQAGGFPNVRMPLDLTETLVGFQKRFDSNDIFRSASEICDLWLVPQGQTYAGMPAFWSQNLLSGDNVRERPYADIYPRLTTKSNTYTVHYRVQTLKKVRGAAGDQWVEGKDQVTAENRGASTFERYLDTSDTSIKDYATLSATPGGNPPPIDQYYKYRVLETKLFTP